MNSKKEWQLKQFCISEGDTLEEVLANIREAIEPYLGLETLVR
jgi:predicted RNase H-like HicB family nuclease